MYIFQEHLLVLFHSCLSFGNQNFFSTKNFRNIYCCLYSEDAFKSAPVFFEHAHRRRETCYLFLMDMVNCPPRLKISFRLPRHSSINWTSVFGSWIILINWISRFQPRHAWFRPSWFPTVHILWTGEDMRKTCWIRLPAIYWFAIAPTVYAVGSKRQHGPASVDKCERSGPPKSYLGLVAT